MTLDPTPSVAELLRMKQEREARRRGAPIVAPPPAPKPALVFPVRLRIPWSLLVSDNAKYTIGGGATPRIVLTDAYRSAKTRIRALASQALGEVMLANGPLRLRALVYMPDHRPHDCGNFRKLVTDALEGVVYVNDKQLRAEEWLHAGVDVDAPRAEITISPLALA